MTWLSVFVAMAVLDFFWADYTASIAGKKSHRASFMAVLIILFSGFVTTSYVADKWLLIPAGMGAYAGTWLSIWRGRK